MIKLKRLLSLLVFCLLLASVAGRGQINLVLNPSFETYSRCPTNINQIFLAKNWSPIDSVVLSGPPDSNGNPNCSPELCHICASNPDVSVPNSNFFHQHPHTGNGMAMVAVYNSEIAFAPGWDYLQGRLKRQLLAGHNYCVNFNVVLTGSSAYFIDRLGAYLDDGSIDTSTLCGFPETGYTPQIEYASIISDSVHWTKIEGSFIANGTEKFITIGNFKDADHTDTIANVTTWWDYLGTSFVNPCSWYLIDDVSVIDISTAHAYAGHDTSIALHDSVWVGNQDGYLPCYWYKNGVLVDSNVAGFWARPDTSCYYTMALDVCGNITRDTMHITVGHVGIPQHSLALAEGIKLYPNPTLGELAITGLAGNTEYRVLSVTGAVMQSGHLHRGANSVDMGALRSGVYMMELVGEDGERVVRRVVRE